MAAVAAVAVAMVSKDLCFFLARSQDALSVFCLASRGKY